MKSEFFAGGGRKRFLINGKLQTHGYINVSIRVEEYCNCVYKVWNEYKCSYRNLLFLQFCSIDFFRKVSISICLHVMFIKGRVIHNLILKLRKKSINHCLKVCSLMLRRLRKYLLLHYNVVHLSKKEIRSVHGFDIMLTNKEV